MWSKIEQAFLRLVVPIAVVIACSLAASGQGENGAVTQAPHFSVIDLTPSGYLDSHGSGISGGSQVGDALLQGPTGRIHALLWRGSAESVVDLSPGGFVESEAFGVCGGQQVGQVERHAVVWRGSATSMTDLHPSQFDLSEALSTSGGQQVGFGDLLLAGELGRNRYTHALLWFGSAASVVDLHPSGFDSSHALSTSGIEQVGWGTSSATGGNLHALSWRRASADSVIDLHPSGFSDSVALGISRGERVGYGFGPATGGHHHALLWRGSEPTVVDLHPAWFVASQANATSGGQQVGWGRGSAFHALLWRGSAASVEDLHAYLSSAFKASMATGIDAVGNIIGVAATTTPWGTSHTIVWKRYVPVPNTPQEQSPERC